MDIDVIYLKDHDIHLIKAKGRLDSYYASHLENSLEPLLRRAKKIILECSDVTFLKQCWNKTLLSLMNGLKSTAGKLLLLNVQ